MDRCHGKPVQTVNGDVKSNVDLRVATSTPYSV